MLNLEDFNFSLPSDRIRQFPEKERTEAKLLVISKKDKKIYKENFIFSDLVNFLTPDDILVLNSTRVIKARIRAEIPIKPGLYPKIELLVVKPISDDRRVWRVLAQGKGKKYIKEEWMAIKVRDEELQIKKESSQFILKFPTSSEDIYSFLERVGEIPLPPYIKRKAEDYDEDYYQTVYGDTYGSIAAPTAGLHFSSELLKKLETKGTKIYKLILHIGEATFLPPTQEELKRGELKEEFYSIPNSLEEEVSKKRGKLIACGTSTVRALESFASSHKLSGETNLFISPGYEFKLVDGMITNFHLPLSPTYILTAAFAGLEFLKEAYSEGLKRNFYFGSYGDSMLIL